MNRLHFLTLSTFGALALLAGPTPSQAAETYQLDPAHTNIIWHANHFGFSNPSGKFATVSGTVMLDEAAPEKSSVSVKVETASLLTGIEKFDTHLKSADFLNVAAFPDATFQSRKVTLTGKDTAQVEGDLTLLGITHPLVLDVKLNKIGENPINKKKTAGFSATGVIKRSAYGITYALPGMSDDIPLTIDAEANLQ